MEETAYFLDLTIASEKPVIRVGAQRNASERDSDGPRNLLNAARASVRRQHIALTGRPLPRVDIVPMYAGADGALLRAAVAAGAKGIVIEALGWGNVNGSALRDD